MALLSVPCWRSAPRPVDVRLVERPLVRPHLAEGHGEGAALQHRHPEQHDGAHQAVGQPCSSSGPPPICGSAVGWVVSHFIRLNVV